MSKTLDPCIARNSLLKKYKSKIEVNPILHRSVVSYQANKSRPYYRWFKYKEGFSAELVEYVLERQAKTGVVLDPFAGSGATLFAAHDMGWVAHGIELLPVGIVAMKARLAAQRMDQRKFNKEVANILDGDWNAEDQEPYRFQHLRITKDAFSPATEKALTQYRAYVNSEVRNEEMKTVLLFAAMCVLENISFTRKDGQYLRWDERSARNLKGKPFNKGQVPSFTKAISTQLKLMQEDLSHQPLFDIPNVEKKEIVIQQGSCLELLPATPKATYDCIITSPPYCNRYDYTRTYALELAYLGVRETELSQLRQSLLSCTVENKTKIEHLRLLYQGKQQTLLQDALHAFENHDALQEVLGILEDKAKQGLLNNPHVVRMIRNYFLESCLSVYEMARITKPNGIVVMINDNVQYGGEEVPVDLILCDFAAAAGFKTEHIWTLGRGKGNSSQQMGAHGRNELRKCAYVWRKR